MSMHTQKSQGFCKILWAVFVGSPAAASTLQSSAQDKRGDGHAGWSKSGLVPPSCCWPSAVTSACRWTSLTPAPAAAKMEVPRSDLPASPGRLGARGVAVDAESLPERAAHPPSPRWSPQCPAVGLLSAKEQRELGMALCCSELCQTPEPQQMTGKLSRFMIYFGVTMLNFWPKKRKRKKEIDPLYLQQKMTFACINSF